MNRGKLEAIAETMTETRNDYDYDVSEQDSLSYIDVSRGFHNERTAFGAEVVGTLLKEHGVIITKIRDFRDETAGMDWRLWFRPIESETKEVTRTETVYSLEDIL
jgi:hypothetical protein